MDKDGSIAPDASQRNAADEAPLKLEEFLPYRLNVAAAGSAWRNGACSRRSANTA